MKHHKRHTVTIKRPGDTLDELGRRDVTSDTVVAENVPCSIEPLSGRELEVARQNFPTATHRVRLFADLNWDLTPRDYLVPETGENLEIADRQYAEGIIWEANLLCGQWVKKPA